MTKSEYKQYLKSKHWKNKKREFLSVQGKRSYACYLCHKRTKLEIHHITYENLGNEPLADLILLCRKCHQEVTFSKDKEKYQKWYEKIRYRNLKNSKLRFQKRRSKDIKTLLKRKKIKRRWGTCRYFVARFNHKQQEKTLKQKYGMFAWKVEELNREKSQNI